VIEIVTYLVLLSILRLNQLRIITIEWYRCLWWVTHFFKFCSWKLHVIIIVMLWF